MPDIEQSPFSALADEYERLRNHGSACLEVDDDDGFDEAFAQAEKVRDLVFATPALTRANAVTKARFMAQIAEERQGDLTDIDVVEALRDLARFLAKD